MLLMESSCFPFCLPELTERAAEAYTTALETSAVRDFFSQLKSLTLFDPGYGDRVESYDLALLGSFANQLGRNLQNLQSLEILGFEDCAIVLMMPELRMPKLRSLHIIGACQQASAQKVITAFLQRHSKHLQELELNVWMEFLFEADDPINDVGLLPQVRHLTVRAPPLSVPWDHFAEICPSLEELTFLYDQDFALNCVQVMEDWDSLGEEEEKEEEMLARHTLWLYRDAVNFAKDLHEHGFRRLANLCPNLKVVKLKITDSSFAYDVTPSKDRLGISWRRDPSSAFRQFRRNPEQNSATRSALEVKSTTQPRPAGTNDEDEEDYRGLTEDEARAAGARVMLQVIRLFDDPSLEAEFGLRPFG